MDVGVGACIFASALVSRDALPAVSGTRRARLHKAAQRAALMLAFGMPFLLTFSSSQSVLWTASDD